MKEKNENTWITFKLTQKFSKEKKNYVYYLVDLALLINQFKLLISFI